MNQVPQEYRFILALAAGITGYTIIWPSTAAYLGILFLLVLGAVQVLSRTWPDRAFFLLVAGQPVVVACGMANLGAGLYAACLTAGLVSAAMGILDSRADYLALAAFFCFSVLVAVLVFLANHVPLPLLVLCIAVAAFILIQSVRNYQFKKHYTGA